jgi:hypothetical protein
VKEGQFLLPGVRRRPADVYIPGWAGGQDAALDVTVINPLQQETIVGAAARPDHALQVAFMRKITGTAEACARQVGTCEIRILQNGEVLTIRGKIQQKRVEGIAEDNNNGL